MNISKLSLLTGSKLYLQYSIKCVRAYFRVKIFNNFGRKIIFSIFTNLVKIGSCVYHTKLNHSIQVLPCITNFSRNLWFQTELIHSIRLHCCKYLYAKSTSIEKVWFLKLEEEVEKNYLNRKMFTIKFNSNTTYWSKISF